MRHFARRYFNLLIIPYVIFKIAVKTKKEPQGFFFAVFQVLPHTSLKRFIKPILKSYARKNEYYFMPIYIKTNIEVRTRLTKINIITFGKLLTVSL